MENDLNCLQCESQFTQENPPRLFVGCGHTFCENCFKKMLVQKDGAFTITCPEDNQVVNLKDGNISSIPKNRALLKIIQSKKGNSSFKDPELEMSKIVKTEQAQNEDEEAREIMEAIALSNSIGSEEKLCMEKEESTKVETQVDRSMKESKEFNDSKDIKESKEVKETKEEKAKVEQRCKHHNKPLEVVCIIDLKKICVNCAIFGEHKGHQFKSLEEIENERMAYYSSILEIMDKKQTINERLSSEQTCSSIMEILSNKKNKMKSSINEKFKKLLESIESKQRESLKNLDFMMQKTETKLKGLMKIDPQVLQKYDTWQEKSYQQIKILEGQDFEAKLCLMFSETAEEADVLDEGDRILLEMNKQEENLINEVELALDNIGVDFSTEIFNHIEGFVDIFDEAKKKKTKTRTSKLDSQSNLSSTMKAKSTQKKDDSPTIKQESVSSNLKAQTLSQPFFVPKKEQTVQQKCSLNHEESLLEIEQDHHPVKKEPQFVKVQQIQMPPPVEIKVVDSPMRREKDVVSPSSKFSMKNAPVNEQMSPRMSKMAKKEEPCIAQERPNKKKLAKLKLPQKFQKIVDGLANDQLEAVDLTNAGLGDAIIVAISEFFIGSKAKTVKFISNKLTDDSVAKFLPYMRGVITLNLSQNQLTERTLQILLQNRGILEQLKTVILSQNKINQRKAKPKLDKLRSLDLIVSL